MEASHSMLGRVWMASTDNLAWRGNTVGSAGRVRKPVRKLKIIIPNQRVI